MSGIYFTLHSVGTCWTTQGMAIHQPYTIHDWDRHANIMMLVSRTRSTNYEYIYISWKVYDYWLRDIIYCYEASNFLELDTPTKLLQKQWPSMSKNTTTEYYDKLIDAQVLRNTQTQSHIGHQVAMKVWLSSGPLTSMLLPSMLSWTVNNTYT